MLSWFLVTLCLWCVLLHLLLLNGASLDRPLITVFPGGVALSHLLALLHLLCSAVGHIILYLQKEPGENASISGHCLPHEQSAQWHTLIHR